MDEDNRDEIEKFLGLEPTVVEPEILPPITQMEPSVPANHAQTDYDFSRERLRELIEQGQALFGEAAQLASAGQQPEHFAAAANIFKATVDANEKLLKLSHTHQKITGAGAATNITQNNLVVSSNDLLKLMKQAIKDGNSTDK